MKPRDEQDDINLARAMDAAAIANPQNFSTCKLGISTHTSALSGTLVK
jgi:hypothetical protein